MLTSHDEEFADHSATLSDILLDEFGARHSDEFAVCMVGDGTGKEGLSGTGRTVEEDTAGRGDFELLEDFRVQQRKKRHLLERVDVYGEVRGLW